MRLNHAVLFVTDLARSERFYTEVFGMDVAAREPRANAAFLRLPRSGNHHDLGLLKHLTREEYRNLKTFDEADFVVFTNQQWDRFDESHAPDVRVHWPDGHYTDGLDPHLEDLKWLFAWAPNLKITSHPVRVAKGNLVSAIGVFKGTFSQPMPDGNGGFIPPTGKTFAMTMVTVGIFNRHGTMDEEFLFYDNLAFNQQIGLA
jgi:catechol 2,3-dioxygenase-like lactoylglutathione lyase family enzyme